MIMNTCCFALTSVNQEKARHGQTRKIGEIQFQGRSSIATMGMGTAALAAFIKLFGSDIIEYHHGVISSSYKHHTYLSCMFPFH